MTFLLLWTTFLKLGQTPLHHAAIGGHAEVVSLLLQKGADSQSVGQVRASLINMLGLVALSQLLIDVGLTRLPPLTNHYYSMDGHFFTMPQREVMQSLYLYYGRVERIFKLETGLEPLLRRTWVIWSCFSYWRLLTWLSSSYEPLLQIGLTPLHYAAEGNHAEVVSLLLEMGADIQAVDMVRASLKENSDFVVLSWLLTVVDLAWLSSSYEPILQEQRRTPLHNAAYRGHAEVVSLLLEKGADIQAEDLLVRASLINMLGYVALSQLLTVVGLTWLYFPPLMNVYYSMCGHHFIMPPGTVVQRLYPYYWRRERIFKLKTRLEPLL